MIFIFTLPTERNIFCREAGYDQFEVYLHGKTSRIEVNCMVSDLWSEEPRPKVEASSKEKANLIWGQCPQAPMTIHPRAQHGAFWLFHVKF
jgi:hypothetical protein